MRTASTRALLATGAILAAAVVNTPVAQAEEEAAGQTLVFDKGAGPTTGKVVWSLGTRREAWQAGSGNGGNWNNDCIRNQGHLPNGNYRILAWNENYRGTVIFGRAIRVEDKQCSNGTWRTELFVHSEQTVNNQQGGTEGTRWDGDADYKSAGCVKMHPADIAALYKISADAGARPTVLTVVS